VLQVRHDDRRVLVGPAPRGKQPTWGGFIPQFLGEAVCRKIRDVLASEAAVHGPNLLSSGSVVLLA
jgi:ATP-dependent helicase Lhr and Lhr-like helicase